MSEDQEAAIADLKRAVEFFDRVNGKTGAAGRRGGGPHVEQRNADRPAQA